jgi:tetratricopeptide (TPR) repeat protein
VFGRKAKIRKAVARAIAGFEHESDVADHAPIEMLPADLQAEAFARTALALFDDERYAAAKRSLDRALALAPNEVDLLELAAQIAIELGDRQAAIDAQRRVVAARPRDVKHIENLAELLIAAERIDEVIALLRPVRELDDPALETKLAEALYVSGACEEALAILDPICEYYDAQLKQLSPADWQALKARADDASRLRDDVYAELHGREATIELHAAAGKLDARAGVNFRLLGAKLAAESQHEPVVLELDDPDASERRGLELLARDARDPIGHVLVGVAHLRRGEAGRARKAFERASEADGRCFAAFLGIGAALDCDKHGYYKRALRFSLPATLPAELARIVPDWPALTDAERRVVWASAEPLAKLLPRLAERGVTMRILPIDVRATDIELFATAAGERANDQRSYDAISGVATHGGAIAKIEELLEIGEHGWTFAHELAHLAFFHLDKPRAQPLLAIYKRAVAVGYANIEYALSNADEFFAVSYCDYLRARHELADTHPDDAGIQASLVRYFDELCA